MTEDMLIAIAANDTSFGSHTTSTCGLASISHFYSLHLCEGISLADLVNCKIFEFGWLRLLPLSTAATTEIETAPRAGNKGS